MRRMEGGEVTAEFLVFAEGIESQGMLSFCEERVRWGVGKVLVE